MNRLVLGTAQLGMNYGIANTTGKPDITTACKIVHSAWEGGIREFDTAQAYGTSEKVLGIAFSEHNIPTPLVNTKLNPELNDESKKTIIRSVEKSLKNLRISKFNCLMLHGEHLLDRWNDGLGKIMEDLVESKMVERIGISVYSPEAARRAKENRSITALQIPSNILDRRFVKTGLFEGNHEKDMQIYVRSVYLQGLLLADSRNLPSNMKYAKPIIAQVESLSQQHGISIVELALGYSKKSFSEAKIIIGVETTEQMRQNLKAWASEISNELLQEIERRFDEVDGSILNPTLWPK